MASKAKRSALAVYGLGSLAEGFGKGMDTQRQLAQYAAERAIKQEQLAMDRENQGRLKQQALLDARLNLLGKSQGTTSMDAAGNQTIVTGAQDYSIDDNFNLVPGAKASPGSKTFKYAPQPGGSGAYAAGGRAQLFGQTQDGKALIFNPGNGGSFTVKDFPQGTGTPQPKIAPTLSAGEVATTSGLGVLDVSLKQMEDNLSDDYVGPVASRLGKGRQYTPYASEQAGRFYGSVGDIRNQLIYLRSGKQINEQEYGRLLSTLPNEGMNSADFRAKLANFKDVFAAIKSGRQTGFSQAGYRNIPAPTEQSTLPVPPPPGSYVGGGQQAPSFSSPEAAEAANLPKGTVVLIGGRRAVIE